MRRGSAEKVLCQLWNIKNHYQLIPVTVRELNAYVAFYSKEANWVFSRVRNGLEARDL